MDSKYDVHAAATTTPRAGTSSWPPSLRFPSGSLPVSVDRRAGPTGKAGARAPAESGGPRTAIDKPESIEIKITLHSTQG